MKNTITHPQRRQATEKDALSLAETLLKPYYFRGERQL